MKFCIALLACIAISFYSFSQTIPENPNVTDDKGLRQGKWTVLFSRNWKAIESSDSVVYYRLISYRNDIPYDTVRDFYVTGELQWSGLMLSDRPTEVNQGLAKYYRKDGTLSSTKIFDKGEVVSEKFYTVQGTLYWRSLLEEGDACYMRGDLQNALTYYEKALVQGESEFGKKDVNYAYTLNKLGFTLQLFGQATRAEKVLLEAIKIDQSDSLNFMRAAYHTNLGYVYYDMGNLTKALETHTKALKLKEKIIDKKSESYGLSLHNVAYLELKLGKMENVVTRELEAIAIYEAVNGKDHPKIVSLLNVLGNYYRKEGMYEKAEEYFLRSNKIVMNSEGLERISYYPMTHKYLGVLYTEMGRFKEAEELFKEAWRAQKEYYGGANHPEDVIFLTALAGLYTIDNRRALAEPFFIQANQRILTQINKAFPALSELEKDIYLKSVKNDLLKFNSFCVIRSKENPAIVNEMYNAQLATKALLLNSSAKWKQRIKNSGDKKLFAMYVDWEQKHAVLAKWQQDARIKKPKIDSLERLTNFLEKELSQRSELFVSLAEKKMVTWNEIKSRLKPGEAAIEIIRVPKFGVINQGKDKTSGAAFSVYETTDTIQYAALILTPASKQPEMVLIKNGNELETKFVKYYRNAINGMIDDLTSYDKFWKPIETSLKQISKRDKINIDKVYLSPDGVYNQINLNTLFNPVTKQFLFNEIDIHLVTNTKDILVPEKDEAFNNLVYLYGFPTYGTDTKGDKSSTIEPLPATKVEVEQIARLLTDKGWAPEVLIGDKALEETIKDCFKPKTLHIATHGYFESATSSADRNPLLNSGLLLAGAGETLGHTQTGSEQHEDGILTAYEAMNLNLDNTDLVILSACETGLGEVKNGEGVYGLQRAFKVAGARTIIMSLWKVDDAATKELMTAFYEQYLNGLDKRSAFKLAKEQIRKKYPHPYYWGRLCWWESELLKH